MMRNPIRRGNKAALIVGILFFVADNYLPLFHEFGAWIIGCLFCFYYSATAISTSVTFFQPPIGRMIGLRMHSALNSELNASARALS